MNTGARPHPKGWSDLVWGFLCIFGGLSLPFDVLGRWFVRVHAQWGSLLVPATTGSGAALAFAPGDSRAPWSLPLVVTPYASQGALTIPIDTRALLYLPTACFVALALATPLPSFRQNARLLALGLLVLEPLLTLLVSVPVLSVLSGAGPVRVLELGIVSRTLLQLIHRALVAPPAMAYALPLLLWWLLVPRNSDIRRFHSDFWSLSP